MMNSIQSELRLMNNNRQINSILIFLEQKTGFEHIFGTLVIYLMFGWKSDFFCNSILFLIPVYATSQTVGASVTVDDTKWLLYWIVYTLFNFLEYFLYNSLRKFGLYWLSKFIFLIWFMIPGSSGGSNLFYYQIIRPLLIHFQFIQETDTEAEDEDDSIDGNTEVLMEKQDELKEFYDEFPNIDDVINETDPNMKKAKEFTQSILRDPPAGDVTDVNTLWHILSKLLGNNHQPCLFYDSQNDIKLHDASANLSDINSDDRPFVLTLSSSEGLGNVRDVNSKKDEWKLVQSLTDAIEQKQSHPVLEDIIQRLSEIYAVNKRSIIIKNVYVGSFNIVYTVMDLSVETIQQLVGLSQKLKKKFKRFLKLKIHPLLFRPSFDVSQFDKRGNKNFTNENQTFSIGPPGRTQPYTQATGWTRYGLKVLGRYANDTWLDPFQDPKNWYRAFHGTGNAKSQDFGGQNQSYDPQGAPVDAMLSIYQTGFRPARVAAYGSGVYCSPNPAFPENGYVRPVLLDTQNGKKSFKCMLQVAVNPDGVKIATSDIWVVPDPKDIRPYGLLIKEG